jgi:hypothetical protein
MNPKPYRKKPVEIEAVQITDDNAAEVARWSGGKRGLHSGVVIETLEGAMKGNVGDYIIKGVNGEFYPCKPDIFDTTYEEVE